jgi:PAS domain-containing protein
LARRAELARTGGDALAEEIDFHSIFKLDPTAMLLVTTDLCIADANDELVAEAGRSLEDSLGRNFYEVFQPEERGGSLKWTALE